VAAKKKMTKKKAPAAKGLTPAQQKLPPFIKNAILKKKKKK
jgi:hypothetical protein